MSTRADPTYTVVKDALISVLRAGVGDPDVKVFDCFPNPDDMKRECVVVGSTDDGDTRWGPLGDRAEDETYSVIVDFFVYAEAVEPRKLRDRAFALFNAAHADIRTDPTLGLLATVPNLRRLTAVLAWREVEELPWDDGRVCAVRANARIIARI